MDSGKFPFAGEWSMHAQDSAAIVDQFANLVGDVANLLVYEREDADVIAFVASDGLVRHLVTWAREGWVCTCTPFREKLNDCPATILVRMVNASV